MGSERVRVREVLFRGSTAEAIELLGSRSSAAVELGARKLIHEAPSTRAAVLKAIKEADAALHGKFAQ